MSVQRGVRVPLALAALSVLVSAASLLTAAVLALLSTPFRSGCVAAEGPPQVAHPLGQFSGAYEFASASLLVLLWLVALGLAMLTVRLVGPLLVRVVVGVVEAAVLVALGAVGIYALGLIQFLLGFCL
jgi:hypothetical protein